MARRNSGEAVQIIRVAGDGVDSMKVGSGIGAITRESSRGN